MAKSFNEHLDPNNGIKRILSLDGGGIRGALTLGYLEKLESSLRKKEKNPNLLLCDYFDLIGGTSTGSIIASALALGYSVADIVKLYLKLGGQIFRRKRFLYIRAKFNSSALEKGLRENFKDIKLGSNELKTGLCIVTKRADTNSIWPLINHPEGKFYDSNKDILLWQAIRASCAAPTYFKPILLDIGEERAAFIDGGVSMANNPSLTLLMVATLNGFPFGWEMCEEKLSMISIGTGYSDFQKKASEIKRFWWGKWGKNIPDMLMQDSNWHNQIIMQWLSSSPIPHHIDMEIQDLKGDLIGNQSHIKYLRYNFPITVKELNSLNIGRDFTEKDVVNLVEMSNGNNADLLYKIGQVASEDIVLAHLN